MNYEKKVRDRLAAKRKQLVAEWKEEKKIQSRTDKMTNEVRSLGEQLKLKKRAELKK